jgi:NCAIR mutase (PurE)-related protein
MASSDLTLDFQRPERLGFGEAILCQGKSADQLRRILDEILERRASFLFTRLSAEQHASLSDEHRRALDYEPLSRTAFCGSTATLRAGTRVAVVSAGSSDAPVALEAQRTLRFQGHDSLAVGDVGVAGLWRLTNRLDELRRFPIIIAVAGMDAALPTVLGGLLGSVLIAVPTSTGYGVAHGGLAALNAMLTSCAPGLAVTNIDNGYGAACAALRVLRALDGAAPGLLAR